MFHFIQCFSHKTVKYKMKHFFYIFAPVKKNILIALLSLFSIINLQAQKFNIEPGITLGTSYYLGDINHSRQFYSPGFTAGITLRHSISDFYALKVNILRLSISGNDENFSSIYQQIRGHSFKNTIYELSAQYEINFLSYNAFIKKSQSPYITLGFGIAAANSFQVISPVIPMGIGYKYSPVKRMTLSVEWCFRNTFTDKLDLLEQTNIYQKQLTKIKNNDWYSVAGITVTYSFASEKKWCPAYSKQSKH